MTAAEREITLEDAVAWFDAEQRNIAGLVKQLQGREVSGDALERLVAAASHFYPVRGMWHEWLAVLEPAVASAKHRGNTAREANLRSALGNALQRLGDRERARSEIEEALRIAEEHSAQEVIPVALASLATLEKHDRRPDRAVALLERAVSLYREQENKRGEAQALGDLANNFDDLGRPHEALDLHQQASIVFREIGDRYSEMRELGNAGIALLNLGRWGEAEQALRRVIETSTAFGARRDPVAAFRDLALALAEQERFDEAIDAINEALERVRQLDSPYEEGLVIRQHARVLARMGETEAAREKLQQLAGHFEEAGLRADAAHASSDLGLFLLDQGDATSANAAFDRAIELAPGHHDVSVLRSRVGLGAIALDEGRFSDAIEHAETAVEGFRRQNRVRDLREALRLKGTAEVELGQIEQAERTAAEIEAIDEAAQTPRE